MFKRDLFNTKYGFVLALPLAVLSPTFFFFLSFLFFFCAKVLIGVDGKRYKTKDWTECWAVLNNQFLEFYPDKEARFTKKKVKLDLTGASIEFDKETKRKKDSSAPLRLTTETHGCYQLLITSIEESEGWYKAIQQICSSNVNSTMEEVTAGLARRSHCIPHRFKEAFYTLNPAKCKACNSAIHGRGFRCIRMFHHSLQTHGPKKSFLYIFLLLLNRLSVPLSRKVLDARAP